MTIQTSGQIAISDIVTEFGGTAPHALTEYYRNGGLVPGGATGVPTSGVIKITDFYGAANSGPLSYNGSSSAVSGNHSVGGSKRTLTVAGNRVVKACRIQTNLNGNAGSGTMGIELTGENMQGAGGNISRTGGITESGPTTLPSDNGTNQFGTQASVSNLTVPNNRFLVGVAWTNTYNRTVENNFKTNKIIAYTRHSAYTGATWSGSVSNTGVINSEAFGLPTGGQNPASGGLRGPVTLSSSQICVGFRMGNGTYGEYTDGQHTSTFQMGLRFNTTGTG